MTRIRLVFAFALLILLAAVAASAQPCASGTLDNQALVDALVEKLIERTQLRELASQPEQHASSKSAGAASAAGGALSLVDGASSTDLFSLAIENSIVEQGDDGVLTLNLSPFALAAMLEPESYWQQSRYEEPLNRRLRRLALSASFGGKGEALDSDGDGETEDPKMAEELDDIVTVELRWRFWGTRDRRDKKNYDGFFAATGGDLRTLLNAEMRVAAGSPEFANLLLSDYPSGCVDPDGVDKFFALVLANADLSQALEAYRKADVAYRKKRTEAAETIDGRMIWTAVAGFTRRKEGFGPDKQHLAIRGSLRDHSWNLEWRTTDGAEGMGDPETLELAYEYSRKLLKGRTTWSVSGSYETFDNVPDAKHDTIAKVASKFEFEITDGVKLPVTVTWANHKDLLTDEDEVKAHFGLSYDLSELWKKEEKEAAR